jgi:hemerythrin superfamily protein
VSFAPRRQAVATVAPLDSHADAARETQPAVDDEDLAVGAVVEPAQVVPGGWVIDLHIAARAAGRCDERGIHRARAQPVEQHVDLHATPGRCRQLLDERDTDRVAKHEGLEGDVGVRRADGIEHRRIDLYAVDQRRDVIAGDQRRAQEDAERAPEIRISTGVQAPRTVQQTLLGGREIGPDPQHESRDAQGGEDDRDDGHVLQMRRNRKARGKHLTQFCMIVCYRRLSQASMLPPTKQGVRNMARAKAKGRAKTSRRRESAAAEDAIALLKADHRQVEEWFEQFEKARNDERKQDLATRICNALTVHTTIEEEIFYPAFLEATGDKDTHHEAEIEHEGAKKLIAEIEASTPDDDYFDSKIKVLSEMIKHHVKEEERPGGMFAEARKADMDLDELGEQMATRKAELENQMADMPMGARKGKSDALARMASSITR